MEYEDKDEFLWGKGISIFLRIYSLIEVVAIKIPFYGGRCFVFFLIFFMNHTISSTYRSNMQYPFDPNQYAFYF